MPKGCWKLWAEGTALFAATLVFSLLAGVGMLYVAEWIAAQIHMGVLDAITMETLSFWVTFGVVWFLAFLTSCIALTVLEWPK